VKNTTVTLNGVLNPHVNAVDGWYFEYNAGASCAGGSTTAAQPPEEAEERAEQATVSGLQQGRQYTFCLVATNEAEETTVGNAVSFTTTTVAPVISEVSFSDVGSGSAKLTAQIDPEGVDTIYRFEYGTSAAYGQSLPMPDGDVGDGSVPTSVQVSPQGLTPGTAYHFRVVASSSDGETRSADASFSTLPVGILGLPDERVFEMVSPPEDYDANVYVPFAGNESSGAKNGVNNGDQNGIDTEIPFQAESDGNAVSYVADPTRGGDGIAGQGGGNQYLATRAADGGWAQTDITPPQTTANYTPLIEGFTSDLSSWIVDSDQPLSENAPTAPYQDLYSYTATVGAYRPLFVGNPPTREPEEFGTAGVTPNIFTGERDVLYAGGSSNLSHILFAANDALTDNAPRVDEGENNLYDSVDGQLNLVNVLPNGVPAANAMFGAPALSEPARNLPDFSHIISSDGSRIFWTDLSTGQLFVRENDGTPGATTVQVDASQGPDGGGGGRFWTASDTGTVVFFTDEKRLTDDSSAAPGEPDLYKYDVGTGTLVDLTAGYGNGGHANVQGVVGASENGAYIYFVAGGVLADGAKAQECSNTEESEGLCNLYVLHEGEQPAFIATLSAWVDGAFTEPYSDGTNSGNFGDWQPGIGKRTAEVAADGRGIAFMSSQSLTGYANTTTSGGQPQSEVYVYEFGELSGAHLVCVSCSRSGEPPVVESSTAGFAPVSFDATYQPRFISADGGRVFFNSFQGLVPQDTNGQRDVYEWERQGTGSCEESLGCVYLLSGGTSPAASALIDASESGDDVFIVTRAQLVSADGNDNDDLYDARVNGVRPLAPPACSGTGCQGVPGAPPIFATPSSLTFNGVGNFPPPTSSAVKTKRRTLTRAQKRRKALSACRSRGSKRKRAACEAQAKKRYGAKSKAKKPAKGSK
jgi:hypothetical protein